MVCFVLLLRLKTQVSIKMIQKAIDSKTQVSIKMIQKAIDSEFILIISHLKTGNLVHWNIYGSLLQD